MANSECKCSHYSCESIMKKVNDEYFINNEIRFRFEKDNNGCIVDGRQVSGSILDCKITEGRIMSKKLKKQFDQQNAKTL